MRRRIRDGDSYTIDEEGEVVFDEVEPDPDPPSEDVRGEPWGWTKPGPKPRGWREDGRYGPEHPGHPEDPGGDDGRDWVRP